ncbi:MAG TPA: CpsD/CapB family tyrosine-protein kinase [Acidobacteriaceae bacterium]|nr:CpsD/CapB family tyrosine-protein kinase [Acidobacteriaceae bacterium]
METTLANADVAQRAAKAALRDGPRLQPEPVRLELPEVQTVHLTAPVNYRLTALADYPAPAAEAFRLLCVRLRHLRRARPLRSLLITGTSPDEGKSFVAANLACTLAAGSQGKVLLLEGDVRRPSQEETFGLSTLPGLCEYLCGQRSLTESIYRLEEAGIWFLPAGHELRKTPQLLDSAELTPMMKQLSHWFDWIIIDCPPVLPLADTSVWEKLADGILLVARRGVTAKRKLKRGTEALDESKIIGAILNSSTRSNEEDYYRYSRRAAETEPESLLQD